MKTLILLLAILTASCAESVPIQVIVTDPTPPPVVDPDPPVSGSNIVIAYYVDNAVRFYDGSGITTWKTGKSVLAGLRQIINGDILYTLEQRGATVAEKYVVTTPDKAVVDGDNVWLCVNVPPDQALAAGALYKDYTKIYFNATEYGDWMTRQYKTIEFIKAGSDIICNGATGGYRHINGSKAVYRAIPNGFTVYDVNTTLRTGKIDDMNIAWTSNFFTSATSWQKAGFIWYSQNGYTWDGSFLTGYGIALETWRTSATYPISLPEAATVISAGMAVFAEEETLFYIECNSGWLFQYRPSTNQLIQKKQLYTGDGLKATGLIYKDMLKPVCGSDGLYFIFENKIYRYRFDSEEIAQIGDGAEWITAW